MGRLYRIGAVIMAGIVCFGIYSFWPRPTVAPEFTLYAQEWPLPNLDYSNTRASTTSSINSENAANLNLAWSFPISNPGIWCPLTGNPIIQAGIVYQQDRMCNIYALDMGSGALKWQQEYNLNTYGAAGPAIARKRIFIVKGGSEITALDMRGNEKWSRQLSEDPGILINSQPIEYDGMIFTSTMRSAYADYKTSGGAGILYALDYKTGEIKWSVKAVNIAQEKQSPYLDSGEGSMYPPALDTSSGRLFWISEGLKPGPNPSTLSSEMYYANGDSVAALKYDSGNVLWTQQIPSKNLPEMDHSVPVILAALDSKKGVKELLFVSGKSGSVYALNRDNGQALWEVSLDTQDRARAYNGAVHSPMAYHEGVLYVPVASFPQDNKPDDSKTPHPNMKGKGELLAIDARLGNIIWRRSFDSLVMGGATVLNDLVFTSTTDGRIYAFKRQDGSQIWEYRTAGGICGCPAASGNYIVFPVNSGSQTALLNFSL